MANWKRTPFKEFAWVIDKLVGRFGLKQLLFYEGDWGELGVCVCLNEDRRRAIYLRDRRKNIYLKRNETTEKNLQKFIDSFKDA